MNSDTITYILRYISETPIEGSCVKVVVNRRVVKTTNDRRILQRVVNKVYYFRVRRIKETQRELYNGY